MSIPITPTREMLEILVALESSAPFRAFMDALKNRSEAMGRQFSLVIADVELRQLQGQAFELNELIHLWESRESMSRAMNSKPDGKTGFVL